MITSKQRSYLRSMGHELEPIFQIGKSGVTEEITKQLNDALEARELIKIRVLKNCLEEPSDVGKELADSLDGDLIQQIGRIILLFRKSSKNPNIDLPE